MIALATVSPPTPLSKIPMLSLDTSPKVRRPPKIGRRMNAVSDRVRVRTRPAAAADAGQLAGLRHQGARGVPHLDLLVEPAVGDEAAAAVHGEPAGGGQGPQVPGQLHGGRPAPVTG